VTTRRTVRRSCCQRQQDDGRGLEAKRHPQFAAGPSRRKQIGNVLLVGRRSKHDSA
jgi:hypothetical protein